MSSFLYYEREPRPRTFIIAMITQPQQASTRHPSHALAKQQQDCARGQSPERALCFIVSLRLRRARSKPLADWPVKCTDKPLRLSNCTNSWLLCTDLSSTDRRYRHEGHSCGMWPVSARRCHLKRPERRDRLLRGGWWPVWRGRRSS